MSILPDWLIERDVSITPFSGTPSPPGVISYGLSHYGYDVRVGKRFKVFTNVNGAVVDPKNFDLSAFVDMEGDQCIIPPNSFALAETVERICVPRDCIGLVVDKSSYRRCGIVMGATVLEPEWQGTVTLEISNSTPLPARIYALEGIAQVLFFRAEHVCRVSYADKKGKYQNQHGITLPRVQEE